MDARETTYLLWPRQVNGGLMVPAGYIAAGLGGADGGAAIGSALVAWLAFDLGLYQARYLVNDLADVEADGLHPGADERQRLAGRPGLRRWVVAAIALRLVVASAVIALLPSGLRAITVAAAAALAVSTVAYEAARTVIRRRPRPLGPGRPVVPSPPEAAVLALIGSGYGLRFGFGVALGGGRWADVALSVAFGWVLGWLAIGMNWILEVAYLRVTGGTAVLERKSHFALLDQMLGDDPARIEHPVRYGRPARLTAWLLAGSAALAVLVATRLGGSPGAGRLALLLGICAVVTPVVVARWSWAWAGLVPVVVDAVAALVLAAPGGRDEMLFLLLIVTLVPAGFRSVTVSARGGPVSQQPIRVGA